MIDSASSVRKESPPKSLAGSPPVLLKKSLRKESLRTKSPPVLRNPPAPWIPEIVVVGPGGIKGFLELGALYALEKEGVLDRVHTYVGVSVGSIISLMLVAGYHMVEIISEAADTDIFQDISSVKLSDVSGHVGLISNHPIKQKLIERLTTKFGFVPSLEQLYLSTGFKYVSVTLNLDQEQVEYMSYETDPDLSCVDAAMLSMNIPLLFFKLKYNECVYVDGALGNPYPVDQYDDGKTDILGLYIHSTRPSAKEPPDSSTATYLHKIIQSTMNQLKKRIAQGCSPRCKHLELMTSVFDSTGLTVHATLKAEMVLEGYRRAQEFLSEIAWSRDVPSGKTEEESSKSCSSKSSSSSSSESSE